MDFAPPASSYSSRAATYELSNFPRWDLNLQFTKPESPSSNITLSIRYSSDLTDYADDPGSDVPLSLSSFELGQTIAAVEQAWERFVKQSIEVGASEAELKKQIIDLKKQGARLFRKLFAPENIKEETAYSLKRLVRFFNHPGPLRILVKSNEFHVPWNLLYIGRPNSEDDFNKFLGFRHLFVQKIEDTGHRVKSEELRPFGTKQPLFFSVQYNPTFTIHQSRTTKLDGLLQALQSYITAVYRDNEDAFITNLPTDVAQKEDFIYFSCHGYRLASESRPYLQMSAEGRLFAADVADSLEDGQLFDYQPLVFINACRAGFMGAAFSEEFAPIFLNRGANSVIAPIVSMPAAMATNFAFSFFHELFLGKNKFEDGKDKSISDVLMEVRKRWLTKTPPDLRVLLYSIAIRERAKFEQRFMLPMAAMSQEAS